MEELRQLNCPSQKLSRMPACGRNSAQKILTEAKFINLNAIASKIFLQQVLGKLQQIIGLSTLLCCLWSNLS